MLIFLVCLNLRHQYKDILCLVWDPILESSFIQSHLLFLSATATSTTTSTSSSFSSSWQSLMAGSPGCWALSFSWKIFPSRFILFYFHLTDLPSWRTDLTFHSGDRHPEISGLTVIVYISEKTSYLLQTLNSLFVFSLQRNLITWLLHQSGLWGRECLPEGHWTPPPPGYQATGRGECSGQAQS